MSTSTEQNSRLDYWQERMKAWKQSGLSGAKFCQANDLNYSRFVYWRQKIYKSDSRLARREARGGFAQVLCQPEPAKSLSLSLPNGLVDNIAGVRELLEAI